MCELASSLRSRPPVGEEGDTIIGLASDGVHSNGFSLIRMIIAQQNLELHARYNELSTYVDERGKQEEFGDILLKPTHIYSKPIVKLLRKYKVKRIVSGMAHITGGGLPGNVIRVLPDHLDAVIDTSAWTVPPIFDFLQAQGKIDRDEMLRVFNMGVGFVLIVRPTFADSVVRQLNRQGERAFIMGKISQGTGTVRLG